MKVNGIETETGEVKTNKKESLADKIKDATAELNNINNKDNDATDKKNEIDKDKVDAMSYSNMEKLSSSIGNFNSIIAATNVLFTVLTIISVLALILVLIISFTTNQSIKNINNALSNYPEEIVNSDIYIEIDILTANILEYKNGVYKTDLGYIASDEVNGKTMLVYYDIYGTLRYLNDGSLENGKFNYVTKEFAVPENGYLITDDNYTVIFTKYIDDIETLEKLNNKSEAIDQCKTVLIFTSIIFAILALVLTVSLNLNKKNDILDKIDEASDNQ
ncbi:MAG: hypothetical protein IJ593_08725 [Lachnospiraceae bacterium]|nr:hypothetical protein [Lachnospiraceae bacterium]